MTFEEYKDWARKLLKSQLIEQSWEWRTLYFEAISGKEEGITDYNNLVDEYNDLLESNKILRERILSQERVDAHNKLVDTYNDLLGENSNLSERLSLEVNKYNALLNRTRQLWELTEETKFQECNSHLNQRDELEYPYNSSAQINTSKYIQQLEGQVEFLNSEVQNVSSFFSAMLNFEAEISISDEPYMPDFVLSLKPAFFVGVGSNFFHKPGCRYLRRTYLSDCSWFELAEDAINKGFEPCGHCCA